MCVYFAGVWSWLWVRERRRGTPIRAAVKARDGLVREPVGKCIKGLLHLGLKSEQESSFQDHHASPASNKAAKLLERRGATPSGSFVLDLLTEMEPVVFKICQSS